MLARDVMGDSVVSTSPDETLREVATRLTNEEIGAACIHEAGVLVGIVTERDISRGLADGENPDVARVDSVMARSPVTITPTTPLGDAVALMIDGGIVMQ